MEFSLRPGLLSIFMQRQSLSGLRVRAFSGADNPGVAAVSLSQRFAKPEPVSALTETGSGLYQSWAFKPKLIKLSE
jgi:hypothetical protein